MPSPKPTAAIEFGPFHLDPERGELRKSGIRISLSRQPLQILLLLLKNPGEPVSRDDLAAALWPEGTYVDFEHGLNAAMNKLRQVLSDSADNPRYIETVPGRGYRFVGALKQKVGAAPPVSGPLPEAIEVPVESLPVEPPAKNRRRFIVLGLYAMGLAALGLGAALWSVRGKSAEGEEIGPLVRYRIFPPHGHTLEPAISRIGFAVSHDGRRLAFTAKDEGGLFSAWMQDLSQLEPRRIKDSSGAFSVLWGQADESLLLSVGGELREVSPETEAYRVLAEAPGQVFSGAWIAPGRLLLSNRLESILITPGKAGQKLLGRNYNWPEPLPGGRLLYTSYDERTERNLCRVVDVSRLDAGSPLVETDSRVQMVRSRVDPDRAYLMYVRAGSLLAHRIDPTSMRLLDEPQPVANGVLWQLPSAAADFSASDRGVLVYQEAASRSQLVLVNRRGEAVQAVSEPLRQVKFGMLSPDGKQAVAMMGDANSGRIDLWLFEIGTGAGRRWTVGPGVTTSPVWSPDGKRIAYGRAAGRPPRLFMRAVAGDQPEQNLNWGPYQTPSDWSADGRYIAFTNSAYPAAPNERSSDIWVMDLARGNKVTPLIQTPFHETVLSFSPDGRHVAFLSNDSGRTEAYVQDFEGGEQPRVKGPRRQISRTGALYLRWRRDGREILYLGADSRIHGTKFQGGQPGATETLFRIDPEALSVLPNPTGFDVSADGQLLLVPVLAPGKRSALTVVQNWERLLENQGKR